MTYGKEVAWFHSSFRIINQSEVWLDQKFQKLSSSFSYNKLKINSAYPYTKLVFGHFKWYSIEEKQRERYVGAKNRKIKILDITANWASYKNIIDSNGPWNLNNKLKNEMLLVITAII